MDVQTVSEYLKKQGLSWSVDELPPMTVRG
jgi:hypothetical protein